MIVFVAFGVVAAVIAGVVWWVIRDRQAAGPAGHDGGAWASDETLRICERFQLQTTRLITLLMAMRKGSTSLPGVIVVLPGVIEAELVKFTKRAEALKYLVSEFDEEFGLLSCRLADEVSQLFRYVATDPPEEQWHRATVIVRKTERAWRDETRWLFNRTEDLPD